MGHPVICLGYNKIHSIMLHFGRSKHIGSFTIQLYIVSRKAMLLDNAHAFLINSFKTLNQEYFPRN
jgi:hypothetical protein